MGLALGDHVRIFGHDFICEDSPCPKDYGVMRDMATGELVVATFGHPIPGASTLSSHGETPESWLAPLTFDWNEYDLCDPVDAGCGNDTVLQRAAVQFEDGDDFGRVLDRRTGWAPLGYHVGVRNWESGDADCQFELWYYAAMYVHRTNCDGDCPAPTIAQQCEAQLPLNQIGYVSISFSNPPNEGETSFSYDLECLVLDVVVDSASQARVKLDCVPPL
ncbi:hypothetical protein [Enhygromyxa salina]|uniref:Uncharacterized protein n=1 Tax=Enhygromyxa salina TaxID=215803 RepID=A0A2S9XLB8_9BACT|nr:hypothetical protein [Enhygromyxa salina]PRP93678.1 hypothetical protein ENSA7_81060 [Enhygromyxa salina]